MQFRISEFRGPVGHRQRSTPTAVHPHHTTTPTTPSFYRSHRHQRRTKQVNPRENKLRQRRLVDGELSSTKVPFFCRCIQWRLTYLICPLYSTSYDLILWPVLHYLLEVYTSTCCRRFPSCRRLILSRLPVVTCYTCRSASCHLPVAYRKTSEVPLRNVWAICVVFRW